MEAGVFGDLRSMSIEMLLSRAEERLRMIHLGVGDRDRNIIDITAIKMEIERRAAEGRPIS